LEKEKADIRKLALKEIVSFCEENSLKSFRGKQVYEWLWKRSAKTFDEMNNLPKNARQIFSTQFVINPLQISNIQKSKDGTIKTAFKLFDGGLVEGVMIPSEKRATACISSQVGCNLACTFCATGKLKLLRNLGPGEIYDQLVVIKQQAKEHNNTPLSNIVLMGMGEPLLNYKNVLQAINNMISEKGLGLSPRRITLSTSGVIKGIMKLADENVKFNLAVSLHTADNDKRNRIMPVNKTNPLDKLAKAIQYFHEKTGKRITFEYLLLKDFNDSLADAQKLAEYCKIVPCKVNLIEFNATGDGLFKKSPKLKTEAFYNFLESKNMVVNIRSSRGEDIDAACGQLANRAGSEKVKK